MRRTLVLLSLVALATLGVADVEALQPEDGLSGVQLEGTFDLWYRLLVGSFGVGLSEESEEPAETPGETSEGQIGTKFDPFDDDPGGGGIPDENECEEVTVCDFSGCTTTITCE